MTWTVVVIVAVVLLAVAWYLSSTAGRLDRLHRKIDTARLALDAQLLRRSAVAFELATSGVLDPATALLVADAAHRARLAADGDEADRARAESELTADLAAALADPEDVAELRENPLGAALLEELGAAFVRLELSRRFLNDAVRACRLVRAHRAVRWFRLAGHTPMPVSVDLDDTRPAGLA